MPALRAVGLPRAREGCFPRKPRGGSLSSAGTVRSRGSPFTSEGSPLQDPGVLGWGCWSPRAWGDPPEAFSGDEYTGMILPLSPPDSGQAVCVWGQWSCVGWVRGRDIFWWMGREQFQVWLPLEAQSSEETLPKPGEAPSHSQLDCKLLQWCLRVHDPRGPAALRDEVTEAVEQPRGGGSGRGHRATARPLLSPPRACRARPHPCSLSPCHGRTCGRTHGRTWGVGPGRLQGREAGQLGRGDPEKTGGGWDWAGGPS